MLKNIELLLVGLGVGVFGGVFGLGGGIIMVPILLYLYKKDIHTATATSLAVIGPMAVSGTVSNILAEKIVWAAFLFMSAGSVTGAYFGAALSKKVPRHVLRKVMGYAVALVALSMIFFKANNSAEAASAQLGIVPVLMMLLTGLVVGIFSGLLGLGGGVILNPVMLFGFGYTAQQTVATSLAIIVPTSISGTIKQYASGHIDLKLAGLLAAGACAGSFGGASLKNYINNNDLKVMLGVAVLLISFTIIFKRSEKE